MGLRRRIANRIYRSEVASFLSDTTTSKNVPPTFVPELVRGTYTNVEDLSHLDKVAREDSIANYIVYKLSENALDDGFRFTDENGEEVMLDVQKELKQLDADRALVQALIAERKYGYAYQYTGKSRHVPTTRQGGRIGAFHTFSPEECVVFKYGEYGYPETMEVTISVGTGQYAVIDKKMKLPAKDFIFWNTRPIGRGYKGRSVLEPVWDMLTYLRYLENSMVFFGIKMGTGLFTLISKHGISDKKKSEMNTALKDISNRRAFVVDGDVIDDIKFIGPGGATTDFAEHIDVLLGMIAAGCGIPKDILMGASGGSNESASTNVKSLFAALNQIQTSIEPYIRELVIRMGYTDENYNIEWNTRYAHDEEEESKIAINKANTLAIRSNWMTKNEIREVEGLPPVEGGDELIDYTKSSIDVDVKEKEQTPDEKEQDRNEFGEN